MPRVRYGEDDSGMDSGAEQGSKGLCSLYRLFRRRQLSSGGGARGRRSEGVREQQSFRYEVRVTPYQPFLALYGFD